MNSHQTTSRSVFAQTKGAILLTAIIFATISAILIGSFIKLANHELRLSNIQFYANESLNLAEAGLDEAMHFLNAVNNQMLNPAIRQGWDDSGPDASFSVRDIPIGRGATGEFDVFVEDWDGDPIVTSEGRVTSGSGLTSTKQLKMTLRPRSYLANGITARCRIDFSGNNAYVDSYRSSEGVVNASGTGYIRRDRGTVATTSADFGVNLSNSEVWGYVFTGGQTPRLGSHAVVRGFNSTQLPIDWENRIAMDFKATFPRVHEPPPRIKEEPDVQLAELKDYLAWLSVEKGITRTIEDFINPENRTIVNGEWVGVDTHKTKFEAGISSPRIIGIPRPVAEAQGIPLPLVVEVNSIDLTSGRLHIVGPVILIVGQPEGAANPGNIRFSGQAQLRVGFDEANHEGADLLMYAYGNATFSGQATMENRTRVPNNMALFGMAPDPTDIEHNECSFTQTIDTGGNSSWVAIIYAPNANISLKGGGNSGFMAGAVVGTTVTITGGMRFHYDEETEAFLRGFGYAMESWKEVPRIQRISFD